MGNTWSPCRIRGYIQVIFPKVDNYLRDQFKEKEKYFFKQHTPDRINFKHIAAILLFILFTGLVLDGASGFPILRSYSNIFSIIGGLFVLGIFYVCGESVGIWFTSKDKVSQPLYRRIFNMCILLGFVALFTFIVYNILKLLNDKM